ncbi:hypothetical protein EXIGLDRAFT_763430 [Exidia glandulosa HHB12029]|uniref:F-box domain-containing protein n=1 Tax=Exidia glandulosa HHB12029 TaxID=1314781 RepID=A0A165M099_EXIGL|nr:hypothetical protein EXIGLDRAFT_763430 [Exidia glandulosa HHB12029]
MTASAVAFHHHRNQVMDRTRQLPVELWEQIIRTLAPSYRPEQKQPLVELTHICWSLAVAARPTLYRTVFVCLSNVDARPVDPRSRLAYGRYSGFANITALGGNPYSLPSFNSLLRPQLVVLDSCIWVGAWQNIHAAIYPVLAQVEHLRLGIMSIGPLESRPLGIPAEVVVVDLIFPDGLLSYFNAGSFIRLVRAFLNEPRLRRLQINLDIDTKEHLQAVHDALQGFEDQRLTVLFQEVAPTSPIPRILHSRHMQIFEDATA